MMIIKEKGACFKLEISTLNVVEIARQEGTANMNDKLRKFMTEMKQEMRRHSKENIE